MSLYLAGAAPGELALCEAGPDGWQIRAVPASLPAIHTLARSTDGRVMYAAHAGSISACAIGPHGALAPLGTLACDLPAPSALAVSPDNSRLYVADRSGAVLSLPVAIDAQAGMAAHCMLPGSSPTDIAADPCGQFVALADPAAHAVHILRRDAAGKLAHHRTIPRPGEAPHRILFHPDTPVAFLANATSIAACHWDTAAGHLLGAQTLRPLPREYSGPNRVTGLVLSPDGRFLFAANAGHDSLATVAVQRRKGKLFLRRLDRLATSPSLLGQSQDGAMLLLAATGSLAGFGVEGRYAMLSRANIAAPDFTVHAIG